MPLCRSESMPSWRTNRRRSIKVDYSDRNPAARMLRIAFVKTIAVVWASMAHAVEGQAGVSFFPEWPRHVPSEVSTCFFGRAGPLPPVGGLCEFGLRAGTALPRGQSN
jgi:hypothetical protein